MVQSRSPAGLAATNMPSHRRRFIPVTQGQKPNDISIGSDILVQLTA